MSGLTPTALYEFRRRLWGREFSLELLASAIPTSRPYLSQVLWGHWASPDTWQKIRAWVTPEEWALLLELEHCATWNKEQAALEATGARPWLMRRRCAKCQKWEGYEPCVGAQAHKITHGLCPSCYEREMELLSVALPRAHLVETEAGLAVHRSATPPALAADRELTPEDFAGSAQDAPITCAPGVGPRATHFFNR